MPSCRKISNETTRSAPSLAATGYSRPPPRKTTEGLSVVERRRDLEDGEVLPVYPDQPLHDRGTIRFPLLVYKPDNWWRALTGGHQAEAV